ncbi:hypothetical protein QN277_009272 [Acacia crassicarpa]|uniref:Uncharacterized protein n=1 Tax=Acacia crassicarpa TaxID=499986 RepID=A0AAE1JRN2_9FABA|nr:hypothetical protein QN277_009272 [Acacia crassicarpa]
MKAPKSSPLCLLILFLTLRFTNLYKSNCRPRLFQWHQHHLHYTQQVFLRLRHLLSTYSPPTQPNHEIQITGEYLVYVSTHENLGVPKASWAVVYSTHLKSGSTRRLTPYGVADFNPSVSPSGIFTAVA